MADEIIDIIHNITYQVQDQELEKATKTVEGNIAGIENLTKRQIRLAKQYNDTVAQDVDKRQRLNRMINQNSAALDHHRKSLEKNLLNNKALNRAMEQELGIIGTLERKLKILQQARRTATSTSEIRRYDGLISQQQNRLNRINNTPQPNGGFMSNLSNLGPMARMLPAIGGAISLANVGSQIKEVTQKFESYRTTLRNTYQSSIRANEEFQKIKEFAEKTPYSVDKLTGSFVKLVNRGFTPTKEELTNMGDLAASQGKSFDQLTEAILDAQTGEFERLKEFGIRAKTTGDNVTLSFKGIEKQVKKTDEQALRRAVITFGQLNGVAGGMAATSQDLQGKISNLGDSFDSLFAAVGEYGKGSYGGMIDWLKDVVDLTKEWIELSPADKLREEQREINALMHALASFNGEASIRNSLISQLTTKYPDLIKYIDLEKASSQQLMGVLEGINNSYRDRIQLAETAYRKEKAQDSFNRSTREIVDTFDNEKFNSALEKASRLISQQTGGKRNIYQEFTQTTNKEERLRILRDAQKVLDEEAGIWDDLFAAGDSWTIGNAILTYEQIGKIQKESSDKLDDLMLQEIQNEEKQKKRYQELIQKIREKNGYNDELKKVREGVNLFDILTPQELGEFTQLDALFGSSSVPTSKNTSSSSSKSKGTKSDPNKDALKRLDDQMKAEQEKLKQKFEEERALLLDALGKGIIDREIYNNRLTSLTEKHNIDLLNVESKFANQRTKFLKGAEKEANTTRIAEIKNSINETIQAIKERSEKEIEALLSSQKEIDAELFQMLADSEQKEIETINRNTQSKLDAYQKQHDELLSKQRIALAELNTENSDAAEKQLKIIEESQQKIEDARLRVIEKGERAVRDIRLKYALQEIKELEKLAIDRINTFTDNEQSNFDLKYEKILEENDKELKALRDKNAQIKNEENKSRRELKKINEQKEKELEEIRLRSELAKQYAIKTSIDAQISELQRGFDNLSDVEKAERQKQLNELNSQLASVQNNIINIDEQIKKGSEDGKNETIKWIDSFSQLSDAAALAAQTIVSSLQSAVESEIRIREDRVERAQRIADRGNAEVLQKEEERLRKAQAQQERYARQQIIINSAQQVSAAMLAVARAAAEGGGWLSLATVLATIGALASGFSMVKSMTSDSMPGFKDGVVGLEGPGTSKSDSIPAKLSRGESVVTAEGTNAGDNAEILRMMNQGKAFKLPDLNSKSFQPSHSGKSESKEWNEMKSEIVNALDEVREAVHSINNSVVIDENGVAAISRHIEFKNRKRNKL